MSYAWAAYWDRLTKSQQATVMRAVEIRQHPTDPEGVGYEAASKPDASLRQIAAALKLLRSVEGQRNPPSIGDLRVYLLKTEEKLSYATIANDPRVRRHLTRTRRSTVESRIQIAHRIVKAVARYRRVSPVGFRISAAVARRAPRPALSR